jgi:hypothetical protein
LAAPTATSKPIDPEELGAALQRWVAEMQPSLSHAQPERPHDPTSLRDAIANRLAFLRNGQATTADDLGSRVTDAFRARVPDHLTHIADAIATHRPDLVRRHAHDLISVVANVGADTMTHLSEQLHSCGQSGDLVAAATLVDDIWAEYENVWQVLSTR